MPNPTVSRDLYADSYYGVPLVLGEDGEWLLTHDLRRAWAALNRFHREACRANTRDYWADFQCPVEELTVLTTWLRAEAEDPDYLWDATIADDPQAVPATYIGF
ncbi:hypothetical protein ACFYMO_30640 [Streptomyces sp. NPDC007025]|uniref:hypothetical protein n=1 Tax=Streptomyces sp. NPDC007025 TaxID=3364771 RepID=UPI0036C996F7